MRSTFVRILLVPILLLSLGMIFGCSTTKKEEPTPEEVKPVEKPVEMAPPVTAPPPVVEAPKPAPVKTTSVYTVMHGDNLWNIAAKPSIYGDPYYWPLIYKANTNSIKDADLIYPGQRLTIDLKPSAAAVNAAVEHAKTRGPWKLGVVEESDKAYLSK